MRQLAAAIVALAAWTSCSKSHDQTSKAPPAVLADLAPTGKLRVAINYGNKTLAHRDAATGALSGVSVDLARELGRRLGVDVELVPVDEAAKSLDAVKDKRADVAVFAIDPDRGAEVDFTAPFASSEGVYVVPQASPIKTNADVDKPGVRVAVTERSAFDLFLTRELKQATLVRAGRSPSVTETMVKDGLDVAAGLKARIQKDMLRFPGLRLLDGQFMQIEQAVAIVKNHPAGLQYLRAFVEDVKADGFVGRALESNHVDGLTVAPQ